MGNPMAKSPDENCHKQKHIKQAQHLTQLPCKKEITFLESCRVGKKKFSRHPVYSNMFLVISYKIRFRSLVDNKWGRKMRVNAPSSINTVTFFVDRTVE